MKALRKLSNLVLVPALCVAACSNNKDAGSGAASNTDAPAAEQPAPEPAPKLISWDIVKEYPHDPTAFTEGLEIRDGIMYEGTGEYGASDVRRTDLATGKVLARNKMDAKYFGEGVTVLKGKIYQLTYREGKGFIYDQKTLKQTGTFTFSTPEGWGMTNNGTHLIYDDGSNILHFMDLATFRDVKQLKVTDEYGPVNEINELELIKGYIYANVWQKDMLIKIDTTTGKVVARVDMSSLRERGGIPPMTGRKTDPEVLNGIAYDSAANKVYITGKNWPKMFEVKLDN